MQSLVSSISESGSSSTDNDHDNNHQSILSATENSLKSEIDEESSNPTVGNCTKPRSHAKVVIVGAGLAGLAAAQRLWSSGIKDIILLDAQNYVGGRVKTIKHSDGILELGAQYFHGAEENPIYDWVNGIVKLSGFEDGTMLMQGRYFTATGEQISPNLVATFLELIMKIKISLYNTKNTDSNTLDAQYDRSAAQEFWAEFKQELSSNSSLSKDKTQLLSLFEWFLRSEAIENGCDLMDEVSMASYIGWTDFSDGATLDFHCGYRSLLEWFINQIPINEVVSLQKEVTNIELISKEQSQNNKQSSVIVHYRETKGDSQDESSRCDNYIECSHVIMTASMGYLKRHLDTLFTPPLPIAKQDLIRTIGYGTVNKIFLHFQDPFWLKLNNIEDNNNEESGDMNSVQADGIKLVWCDDDFQRDGSDHFPLWARDIISFEKVKRQPNLLVGWIGGRGAKLMERESNEFIGLTCLRILQKFLNNKHRPIEPSKLLSTKATRWFSNPYTCGSYSFHSMASQDKDIQLLHEPVYAVDDIHISEDQSRMPSILFAGEATAGELYSTTHGAILSDNHNEDFKNHQHEIYTDRDCKYFAAILNHLHGSLNLSYWDKRELSYLLEEARFYSLHRLQEEIQDQISKRNLKKPHLKPLDFHLLHTNDEFLIEYIKYRKRVSYLFGLRDTLKDRFFRISELLQDRLKKLMNANFELEFVIIKAENEKISSNSRFYRPQSDEVTQIQEYTEKWSYFSITKSVALDTTIDFIANHGDKLQEISD